MTNFSEIISRLKCECTNTRRCYACRKMDAIIKELEGEGLLSDPKPRVSSLDELFWRD